MIDRKSLYLKWYDCYLANKNCDEVTKQTPVKVFVMGVNQWKDEQAWPPQVRRWSSTTIFHRQRTCKYPNRRWCSETLDPPATEPADQYSYDPHDPPAIAMEPNDSLAADPRNRSPAAMCWSSHPTTAGRPSTGLRAYYRKALEFIVGSGHGWIARLIDVHPDGFLLSQANRHDCLEPAIKAHRHTLSRE